MHNATFLALALLSAGCIERSLPQGPVQGDGSSPHPAEVTPDGGRSPGGPPAVLGATAEGEDGSRHPLHAIPRRPRLALRLSAPLEGDPHPFALLEGAPDESLWDDLERAPLRVATRERLVAVHEASGDGTRTLTPLSPLTPGAPYSLAVGAWAEDPWGASLERPFVTELRVAPENAGAVMTHSWPADGTASVPLTLPLLAVRFDDAVTGTEEHLVLEGPGGHVSVEVAAVHCFEVGWRTGTCFSLTLDEPLAPAQTYRILVGEGVRDRAGASVGPMAASFSTRTSDVPTDAPGWLEIPCGLDEERLEPVGGCLLSDDQRVVLRAQANGPARVWLDAGQVRDASVAPRGTVELTLAPLAPGSTWTTELTLVDLAGQVWSRSLELATRPPLAPTHITEVRADPRGPEPRQEYVEVLNSGPVPVDLRGFALSDRPDRVGDVVTSPVTIPANARALLVADTFDPEHPDDAPVPPGVPLVRMGTSLASGGLSNAGEPLFLRDGSGARISAAPREPTPAPGVCMVRLSLSSRSGEPGSFGRDRDGGCTPGTEDRIP